MKITTTRKELKKLILEEGVVPSALTVGELRHRLYEIENQDAIIVIDGTLYIPEDGNKIIYSNKSQL